MAMPEKYSIKSGLEEAIKNEAEIPAFSETARRLMEVVNQPDTDLETIAEIAKLDPGITGKFLRLASSPSYSARYITSIQDALMIIGLEEAQRVATTIVVMGRFTVLNLKIDWEMFWTHSVLTANLLEKIMSSYRPCDGREYLCGLLHDMGKLFMACHFPTEFEKAVMRAMVVGHGLYEAEKECLDVTHAELAGTICHKWKLHPHITYAIGNHHELCTPSITDVQAQSKELLANALYLGNRMANVTRVNIQGSEILKWIRFQDLPEWSCLENLKQLAPLSVDLPLELRKARDIISSVKDPAYARLI